MQRSETERTVFHDYLSKLSMVFTGVVISSGKNKSTMRFSGFLKKVTVMHASDTFITERDSENVKDMLIAALIRSRAAYRKQDIVIKGLDDKHCVLTVGGAFSRTIEYRNNGHTAHLDVFCRVHWLHIAGVLIPVSIGIAFFTLSAHIDISVYMRMFMPALYFYSLFSVFHRKDKLTLRLVECLDSSFNTELTLEDVQ